jgi:hypothetical protein
MLIVTLMAQPFYEVNEGAVSAPTSYGIILLGAEPYGLQHPYRHQTIDDLCEHITAQLGPGESFDLQGLRAALLRREVYTVSVEKELAIRIASHPL